MQCVVPSCERDAQNYVHRFPRSSFLYERWRQAIELGTGESFPKDVDPLEVVICQQHFTGFDGYQEPKVFRNVSLNRQIQLDCCRLCLKLDLTERIATGCGDQIIGETLVHDLLHTTFGIALSGIDSQYGICRDCLERLEMVENVLRYFSKKNQRWNQMLDLIKCEETQWHDNGAPSEEEHHKQVSNISNNVTNVGSPIKLEIEDEKLQDSDSQDKRSNDLLVTQTPGSNDNLLRASHISLTESNSSNHVQEHHVVIPSTSLSHTFPSQSYEQPSNISHCVHYQSKTPSRKVSSSHICHICSKSFTKASGLREHMQIHQGIKNFKCQYCGKSFRTRKNWKIHETVHENFQAYTCGICSKTFTHPSNLKRHQQLHAGAKDYVCNLCGKRFSRLNHLHVHLRAHTGEKPYRCPKCGGCFSTSSGLSKHRRQVCKLPKEDNLSVQS